MPTAVTVGESVKTNKRSTVRSPVYEEVSIESDKERGDSEDEEYEPVDHGVGEDGESEEDEASPKIDSKKNEAQKSIKKNSKKRKSSRPNHGRKEKKRSPPALLPAQDEGPSTSGPPPNFQLVGISRSSSYSTTSISDPEEEPPSRNLPVEGVVNEGYGPAAPNQFLIREPQDVRREAPREDPEEAGPGAHQFELVAHGPSTSGPPPTISRSSSYSTTSISDQEEEPPSRNLPEGMVNEGYVPAAPNREMEDVWREDRREDLEEGAGPGAHQFELVAQDRQPDQELHDTTSPQENQRGFIGPLRDPQRAGLPADAILPGADDRLGEERPEPNEEGPEDLEEDQGRAASPAPQEEEEEANRVVQDQGLQPLEWLEQYRGAQLFEGHPPRPARIREENAPEDVHREIHPQHRFEFHGEEEFMLPQGALGAEMPLLRQEDQEDILEDYVPRQEHFGVHQDPGALNPQNRFEIFEDNVPVHHQAMPRELVGLHREDDLLLAQLAHGEEMPQLRPEDLDLLEDNGRRQEHDGVHQDHGALNPQDQFEIFNDSEHVHQAEDVLQEGGVRWPGEVSLHKYLSEKSLNFGPRHSPYATAQVFLREMDFTQTTRNNWYSQHERMVLKNKLKVLIGAPIRTVKKDAPEDIGKERHPMAKKIKKRPAVKRICINLNKSTAIATAHEVIKDHIQQIGGARKIVNSRELSFGPLPIQSFISQILASSSKSRLLQICYLRNFLRLLERISYHGDKSCSHDFKAGAYETEKVDFRKRTLV
ncbi:hypothetical protein CAEBREN_05531 [Caenorhabditis brenneri]|uniref:Uncharacterized protein n=1 Tax=Caenorhabditis brenneri TaxID=135651 RepID=G0PDW4_CAEBE|nr:hypothetical protein CAEBREN_05531 [Caenorhabditis brenneri]